MNPNRVYYKTLFDTNIDSWLYLIPSESIAQGDAGEDREVQAQGVLRIECKEKEGFYLEPRGCRP